jgi:hypothetical protein
MLELIVLGQVPGTNFSISFYAFIGAVFSITVLIIGLTFLVEYRHKLQRLHQEKILQQTL